VLVNELKTDFKHKNRFEMKNFKNIAAIILIMAFPVILNAKDKEKKTETVVYKTSIDCEACVNKIMSNLPQEKGIKDVKCDLTTKEVTVSFQKDKNNPEQIQRSIEKLGYVAKLTPAQDNKDQKK
jgi:copper chaperone CopZ